MSDLPFVSCLCPTYLRPKLLENAIACFEAQDYPANRRELIILDDAGQIENHRGNGWEVIRIKRRFQSLPEKFNALAGLATGSIYVVWEDDDIYLPWHISTHVRILTGHANGASFTSKPSRVLSTYPGEPVEEDAAGRFHASIAFWKDSHRSMGGWPITPSASFDQILIARMASLGAVGDPCQIAPPSYVFRWGSTGAYHGQALMKSPTDTEWYARAAGLPTELVWRLVPAMDAETTKIMERFKA